MLRMILKLLFIYNTRVSLISSGFSYQKSLDKREKMEKKKEFKILKSSWFFIMCDAFLYIIIWINFKILMFSLKVQKLMTIDDGRVYKHKNISISHCDTFIFMNFNQSSRISFKSTNCSQVWVLEVEKPDTLKVSCLWFYCKVYQGKERKEIGRLLWDRS